MLDTITSVRRVVLSVLFIGIAHHDASAQGRASGAQSCALLSRAIVAKFSAASKTSVDPAGPKELPLGASGTACEWGDVTVQVDPMPAAGLEKEWFTHGRAANLPHPYTPSSWDFPRRAHTDSASIPARRPAL